MVIISITTGDEVLAILFEYAYDSQACFPKQRLTICL